MELPIKQIGLIVLAVIIALGLILFLLSGVGMQQSTYQNTSDFVLSNLTQQAQEAKSKVIIG